MWRNLQHVTGAYSEHAKTKRYEQRRSAWGDAHRAAGYTAPTALASGATALPSAGRLGRGREQDAQCDACETHPTGIVALCFPVELA